MYLPGPAPAVAARSAWRLLALGTLALACLMLAAAGLVWRLRERGHEWMPDTDPGPAPDVPAAPTLGALIGAPTASATATGVERRAGGERRQGIDDHDALRLSRDMLRHLPSGVVYFDRGGLVREANPAARIALGFGSPHGLRIREVFREAEMHEPDGSLLGRAADLIAEAYHSPRTLQRKTLHYSTPGGDRRRLGITVCPLQSPSGTSGIICLLTDLTAIHALEEELQRRRNLSALGEMAAGIAHEFKNSLATISGYAQMLDASLAETEDREHVRRILEEVSTLANVATEFLTFARPLVVQPEPVNLQALLGDCLAALRVQDFPGVEMRLENDFPEIPGDPVWLTYAFMNLLRNGCEAIVQSGHGSEVVVRCLEAGASVQIQFMDDGPGVEPDVAEKIFIPFFTTKRSGSGLGLSMVHKIVTAHRGSVLLADASAGHTIFEVRLPTTPPS